jgi:hypothetical protein
MHFQKYMDKNYHQRNAALSYCIPTRVNVLNFEQGVSPYSHFLQSAPQIISLQRMFVVRVHLNHPPNI